MPDEYISYKYIESFALNIYLFLVFLSIQIWFLWKDIDKKELRSLISTSFIGKNCVYVFSFGIFFIINSFSDGTTLPESQIFGLLAPVCLVFLTYEWYCKLRTIAHKKILPTELTDSHFFR